MDKAKDFEKGWEEYKAKKKQEIEEMARTTCNYNAKNFESCVECIKGGLLSCDRLVQAEKLYNAGYRKIPENAVVMTREEYNNMQFVTEFIGTKQKIGACDFNRVFLQHERKIRKETAEKFAAQMKVLLSSNTYFVLANKEKLHKVIDEICKEITEGVKGVSR